MMAAKQNSNIFRKPKYSDKGEPAGNQTETAKKTYKNALPEG